MSYTHEKDDDARADAVVRFARLVRRETILLLVLAAVAVVAFLGTRAAAEGNRRMHRADAARWYAIGREELDDGHPERALPALRHATILNPEDRTYRLTLAAALRASGDTDAARGVLVRLRSAAPEDARVNVQLARLEAEVAAADAVRFYHAGLDALWEPEHDEERRALRVEIIGFLLGRGWTGRALSEVLALASDIPDTPAAHAETGDLFLRANDPARALRQFRAALQADPQSSPARIGAARAAFELRDYRLSQRYLQQVPAGDPAADERRQLVDRILSTDPLLRGLTARERQQRLLRALTGVTEVADRCRETLCGPGQSACAEYEALTGGIRPLQKQLRSPRRAESHDNVEADLAAIAELSARTSAACGIDTPAARALALIARQHELDHP